MKKEPGINVCELAQRALSSVHGVDVNPYAVAISRFRLLLMAIKACGVTTLANAPAFIVLIDSVRTIRIELAIAPEAPFCVTLPITDATSRAVSLNDAPRISPDASAGTPGLRRKTP